MPRHRISITLDGRIAVIRGWRAVDLIRDAGCKPLYAGTVGGWMIDRHRLGDLLAYLEQRSIAVTVITEKPPADGVADADSRDGVGCPDGAGGLW